MSFHKSYTPSPSTIAGQVVRHGTEQAIIKQRKEQNQMTPEQYANLIRAYADAVIRHYRAVNEHTKFKEDKAANDEFRAATALMLAANIEGPELTIEELNAILFH